MKNVVRALALLMAAPFGLVSAAQEEAPSKSPRPRVFDARLLEQYPALVDSLTAKEKNCGTDDPCAVEVTVSFVSRGGKDYCLAQFPSKIYWNRNNPPPGSRRVEWTLVPDAGVTRTFSFDADLGILPIKNKGQLSSNPNDHGVVPSTDGKTYFYVHSNGLSGVTHPVKYLSIVWLNDPNGTPSSTTCGTIDPIIANDGS
ncbi:MAG TPA: hypothetical protein VFA35_06495 [Burkholderiaceae bacterium]|nr:hypothetical protein [Burkholderiaceae bacterium]